MALLVSLTPDQRHRIIEQLLSFFMIYVPATWRQFVINWIRDNVNYNDPKFDLTLYQVQAAIERIIAEKQ